MPWPARNGHKFLRGHVLTMSGPATRTGAIRLVARAALRIGAGLVTVGAPRSALAEHAARLDAVMLSEVEAGSLIQSARKMRATVIAIGPGLGSDLADGHMPSVLSSDSDAVLDADAVRWLAPGEGRAAADICAAFSRRAVVLTPHPGEFAALCPDLVELPRAQAARTAACRFGAVVVLKGHETIIAAPDGRTARLQGDAPFLATAGAGDVLTGLIAGLLAQRMPPFEAGCAAAWIHAEAARGFGPGLIAEDLPAQLPTVLRGLLARARRLGLDGSMS